MDCKSISLTLTDDQLTDLTKFGNEYINKDKRHDVSTLLTTNNNSWITPALNCRSHSSNIYIYNLPIYHL